MSFPKFVSSAVVALVLGGSGVFAQGLSGAALPAEFPPASFKGKQYVDSRGCVYIRAGVDGNVTWIPRLTRAREHICGAQPTFAKAAPAPEPVAKPEPKVVVAPKPAPKPNPVVAKPVTVAQAPKPQPEPRAVVPASVPARVPVKTVTAPAPKRVAPSQMPMPTVASTCPGFGASSQYITGSGLRCGPQAEPPVSYSDTPSVGVSAAPVMPMIPKTRGGMLEQAAIAPVAPAVQVRIPEGYRPVWKDDRLNPNRGPRSATGQAQMELVWTNTVPRQLIDKRTGRDVTRANPNLVYPYTDLATQQRTEAMKIIAAPRVATKGQTSRRAVISSKSEPFAAPVVKGKSYVQVGTFGVPRNALNTAERLRASGLPVRMGRYTKSGRQYQIVLAGPFGSAQELNSALQTARQAGFRDAFLR